MAEIVGWFSLKGGAHIPIMKGQSKAEAAKKYYTSKHGKDVAKLSSKTRTKSEGNKKQEPKKEYTDYNENLDDFRYDNKDIDAERIIRSKEQNDILDEYVAD